MTSQWPKHIAASHRQPIGAGPKCFAGPRLGDARWHRQPIRLKGNALVLVGQGSVVLETISQRIVIKEGGGCLALPGDFKVSGIPDRVGRHSSQWVYFDDRAIKNCVKSLERAELFAALVAPARHEFYPLLNSWTRGQCAQGLPLPPGWNFPRAFRELLVGMSSFAFMFLKDGYFQWTKELSSWAEGQVLSRVSLDLLPNAYPRGRRQFFFDWKTYQALSPAAWLRRRRMELASVWIRHGEQEVEHIRNALGYDKAEKFARDYVAERQVDPGSEPRLRDGCQLTKPDLRKRLQPFWYVDHTNARDRLWPCEAVSPESALPENLPGEAGEVEGVSNPASDIHALRPPESLPCLDRFWALKSTAIPGLFAA